MIVGSDSDVAPTLGLHKLYAWRIWSIVRKLHTRIMVGLSAWQSRILLNEYLWLGVFVYATECVQR
jgi:hypothetical protein